MPQSPRMRWEYPGEEEDPWFDKFEAFVQGTDASSFAAREDRNLILTGGGTVSWDLATSTLSWSSAIEIISPSTGFLNRIPAGSVVIADGQVYRGHLARAPGANASMSDLGVASYAQDNDNSLIIAVRRGDNVYLRNGVMLAPGTSIEEIGASPGGGGGGDFVWSPGNPEPGGVVFADWALLYEEVIAAGAEGRPMRVWVDRTHSAFPTIPSGAWDLNGWEFSAPDSTSVRFASGATWTIANNVFGLLTLRNISLELDFGVTDPAIEIEPNGSAAFYLYRSALSGTFVDPLINAQGGGAQSQIRIHLYEGSACGTNSIEAGLNTTVDVYLREQCFIAGDAVTSTGDCNVNVLDSSSTPAEQPGVSGTFVTILEEQAALIKYDDAATTIAQLVPVANVAAALDRAKSYAWQGPGASFNGPLNETQVGVTELHIGSCYWAKDHVLKADSQVLIGGSLVSETAVITIREFSGGASIGTFTVAGLLANASLDGGADVALSGGWYGLFLSAANPGETAIIKGARLNVIPAA